MSEQPNYGQAVYSVARYHRMVPDSERKHMLHQLLVAADAAGIPMIEVLDELLTAVDAETASNG